MMERSRGKVVRSVDWMVRCVNTRMVCRMRSMDPRVRVIGSVDARVVSRVRS